MQGSESCDHDSEVTETVPSVLREKYLNTEFFLVRIFLFSDWIQENTCQKKLRMSCYRTFQMFSGETKVKHWTENGFTKDSVILKRIQSQFYIFCLFLKFSKELFCRIAMNCFVKNYSNSKIKKNKHLQC